MVTYTSTCTTGRAVQKTLPSSTFPVYSPWNYRRSTMSQVEIEGMTREEMEQRQARAEKTVGLAVKAFKFFAAYWLFCMFAGLLGSVGLLWVVIHFISKFW